MKHALYAITKNIPPPAVCQKSKVNGIAQLVRALKKGHSTLILKRDWQAAKAAAYKADIKLVWQRIGKGKTVRIWHMGPAEKKPATSSSEFGVLAPPPRVKRKYTKRDPRWAAGGMRAMKLKAFKDAKRKYKRRAARLSAKAPRAVGPLFTGPEARPE